MESQHSLENAMPVLPPRWLLDMVQGYPTEIGKSTPTAVGERLYKILREWGKRHGFDSAPHHFDFGLYSWYSEAWHRRN